VTAVFEEPPESEGGGYVAYAEQLPGALSEVDTLEEARESLRDALEELLLANRQMTNMSGLGKRLTREPMIVSLA
jgi:predicted RNase H-like HicB family nuclease